MKIAALKERAPHELRCAISPESAKLFTKKGFVVSVEKGIGAEAGFTDQSYIEAGAKLSAVPLEIIADADIILKVQPSPLSDSLNELELARPGALIIGLLSPHFNHPYLSRMIEKKLSAVAMELVPRITKAQNMDVLSSQSNLMGYRAVIEACYYCPRVFPMLMTAAGTIAPVKLLVMGVGVAGLQAIATAKRLGCVVSAYDVRTAAKEQAESLGAKFICPSSAGDLASKSGYATEAGKEEKIKQEQFLASIIANYDIIITTAQLPGKKAPILITEEMIKLMKNGAIIVDIATSTGGNVEGSMADEIIIKNGVKIIGWTNLASRVAADSARLYSKNLYNFLEYAIKNNKEVDFTDELVRQMLVIQNGQLVHEQFRDDKNILNSYSPQ